MRKLIVVVSAVLALPFVTAADCDNPPQVCTPRAVRKDIYTPGRWWVCNKDGTAEDPLSRPIPPNPEPVWQTNRG